MRLAPRDDEFRRSQAAASPEHRVPNGTVGPAMNIGKHLNFRSGPSNGVPSAHRTQLPLRERGEQLLTPLMIETEAGAASGVQGATNRPGEEKLR